MVTFLGRLQCTMSLYVNVSLWLFQPDLVKITEEWARCPSK